MFAALHRKARRLAEDPVLRHWTAGAVLGRRRRPAPFTAHLPPYLQGVALPHADDLPEPTAAARFRGVAAGAPQASIELALPGETVTVAPGEVDRLLDRVSAEAFDDTETLLALHRFAWVPLHGLSVDPAWVDALWRGWSARFAVPDDGWAWHPYTAAERAINLLAFARRHGLPGERDSTLRLLARHAAKIARRLEYFGDHDTSNHLSNNGRGLYLLGLGLGMPRAIDTGQRILLAEAERIFLSSGVMREGSSHYHLLLARNYLSAWLAAAAAGRPEAAPLRDIAARALAVLPGMVLPGGMPLVGDISPDCPPAFLAGLLPEGDAHAGWCALLDAEDRAALASLRIAQRAPSPDRLASDGWVSLVEGPWSALWYVAPQGWPPMPGHAHQDMGSFEAHFRDERLIVDPGRGAYGERGETAFYASAAAHNTLMIEGREPYPPNKPYYDDGFRRDICGPPPRVQRRRDGIAISHSGFGRLPGVGEVERHFTFAAQSLAIADCIEGSGRRRVQRRLHTPWPTRKDGDAVLIRTATNSFRVIADAPLTVSETKLWSAYGEATPGWVIEANLRTALPARLQMRIEALDQR